ncbi:HAMP domain-containing histidine kinase [Paraburkholderia sp. Ac-20340]|uniref:sensor histidine kinase n=1 Tax=Paraburkholderia sp. Ac-20340 TaxID=2703888 RepID=UPI00197E800A|nr:sensor histidine kinase [Paraburkholderia sp. Ac-20340]MBN3858284.1 HAMP domain-containing histidine kinase [Paraburkholderia sp. Ac-20340]
MNLADFIEADLDGIIDDWTDYARAISPADSHLQDVQLRNSARELLLGIAADMRVSQSAAQQEAKSHGERPDPDSTFNQIGRGHADDRQAHGFGINALVAEYRALRASVLRRWQRTGSLDITACQDMIRFNEAIDQMVAESVRQFAQRTERIRDLFAGVLAHDMRSPVGAILNSAQVVLRDENLAPLSLRATTNLQRSAERLKLLIDDLFVFTRVRLGDTLPVEFTQQDFGRLCRGVVDEVLAARPDAQIETQTAGELTGVWDAARMNQLIANLVTNAVQYGSGMVRVKAAGDGQQIVLTVSNEGAPIPARALPTLFDPLTRADPLNDSARASSGVGLGLYICRCIAQAHHGTIGVESDEHATAFTVKIPRFPAKA